MTDETVEQKVEETSEKPSRVIFFIGDGMGMNFVSAAENRTDLGDGQPIALTIPTP